MRGKGLRLRGMILFVLFLGRFGGGGRLDGVLVRGGGGLGAGTGRFGGVETSALDDGAVFAGENESGLDAGAGGEVREEGGYVLGDLGGLESGIC